MKRFKRVLSPDVEKRRSGRYVWQSRDDCERIMSEWAGDASRRCGIRAHVRSSSKRRPCAWRTESKNDDANVYEAGPCALYLLKASRSGAFKLLEHLSECVSSTEQEV